MQAIGQQPSDKTRNAACEISDIRGTIESAFCKEGDLLFTDDKQANGRGSLLYSDTELVELEKCILMNEMEAPEQSNPAKTQSSTQVFVDRLVPLLQSAIATTKSHYKTKYSAFIPETSAMKDIAQIVKVDSVIAKAANHFVSQFPTLASDANLSFGEAVDVFRQIAEEFTQAYSHESVAISFIASVYVTIASNEINLNQDLKFDFEETMPIRDERKQSQRSGSKDSKQSKKSKSKSREKSKERSKERRHQVSKSTRSKSKKSLKSQHSGPISSQENNNTNNSSSVKIEPIKLRQNDIVRAKEFESTGSFDPAKSSSQYMLSASVFKMTDVPKPPLTKPKKKMSSLNKLKDVAEETSFKSSKNMFIMDVTDLDDEINQSHKITINNSLSKIIPRSALDPKMVTSLQSLKSLQADDRRPKVVISRRSSKQRAGSMGHGSQGPQSRPSLQTQQSLKQLPGDQELLAESEYDIRAAQFQNLVSIEQSTSKRSDSVKRKSSGSATRQRTEIQTIETTANLAKLGTRRGSLQSEPTVISSLINTSRVMSARDRYSAYADHTPLVRSSSATSSKVAKASKPAIKMTSQPPQKMPLPKATKPTRVGLKMSTTEQSTKVDSFQLTSLGNANQTAGHESVLINSFRQGSTLTLGTQEQSGYLEKTIAIVTFADPQQKVYDKIVEKRSKRLAKRVFNVFKSVLRVKRQKEKLARMFYRSRLVQSVLTKWRAVVKQMKIDQQDRERINEILSEITDAQKRQLKQTTFGHLKTHWLTQRKAKAVISKLLSKLQHKFESQLKSETIKTLQLEMLSQRLTESRRRQCLAQCFGALKNHAVNRQQRSQFANDIKQLFETQLLQKTFSKFVSFRQLSRSQRHKRAKADSFWKQRHGIILAKSFFHCLANRVVQNKTKRWASTQYQSRLVHRCLMALKSYAAMSTQKQNQFRLVSSFYKCQLATKALNQLKQYKALQTQKRNKTFQQVQQKQVTKFFKALKSTLKKKKVTSAMPSGQQIAAAHKWLELSFEKMMKRIWMEFPKQKIEIDTLTQQPILLPNYLSLSKRPRYREFFFQSNDTLRRFILLKLIKVWKGFVSGQKTLRERVKLDRLSTVFTAFRSYVQQLGQVRRFVKVNNSLRHRKVKLAVFGAIAAIAVKLRTLRNVSASFMKYKIRQTKKRFLKRWCFKFTKAKQLQKNQLMHQELGVQKTQAKYLALWLQALRIQLKSRHLDKLCTRFQRQTIRRRYLHEWMQACKKKLQSDEIQKIQERHLMANCWNALIKNADKRQAKKTIQAQAAQEYTYWLGKRVISLLRRNVAIEQALRALNQQATMDYKTNIKRRVLRSFFKVATFLKQRRLVDGMITKQIQTQVKRKYMKAWTKHFAAIVGLKAVAILLRSLQLKTGLCRIKRRILVEDAMLAVHKKQAPRRTKQIVMNIFKMNAYQRCRDRKIVNFYQKRRISKFLDDWKCRFAEEKAKVRTFYITFLAIKNELVGRALKALYRNMRLRKAKRFAAGFREARLQRVSFDCLLDRVLNKRRDEELSSVIRQNERHKVHRQVLFVWIARYNQRKYHRACLSHFRKRFLTLYFHQLILNAKRQQEKQIHVLQLREGLQRIQQQQALQKFSRITKKMAVLRKASRHAVVYHCSYLFKAAARAWFGFYRSRKHLISTMLHRQRKAKFDQKRKYMKCWTSSPRVARTLRQIRAASRINKLLNQVDVRKMFFRWLQEAIFLIKLINLQEQGRFYFDRKRRTNALRQMYKVTKVAQFNREKLRQTELYENRKLAVKVINALHSYKERKIQARANEQHALTAYISSLLTKTLKSFQLNLLRKREHSAIVAQIKNRQVQIYLPQIFGLWLHKTIARQNARHNNNQGFQYRVQTLQVKALRALLLNRERKCRTRYMNALAARQFKHSLVNKSMRTLLWYLIYRREKQQKKAFLFQTVRTIDVSTTIKACFEQLKIEVETTKQLLQLQEERRRTKNAKRSLLALRAFAVKAQRLRACKDYFETKTVQARLFAHFDQWRSLLKLDQTAKQIDVLRQSNILYQVFNALKSYAELAKKENMLRRIRSITLAVKAFQAMKNYAGSRQEFRQLKIVAQLQRAVWLKNSALIGFKSNQVLARREAHLSMKTQMLVVSKAFAVWERSYQLKVWRRHFFYSCERFVLRKHFRIWSAQAASLSVQSCLQVALKRSSMRAMREAFTAWKFTSNKIAILTRLVEALASQHNAVKRLCMHKLTQHLASSRSESAQILKTIRMFENSRPANLLLFAKCFMQLNTDRRYVAEPAICATTLQKYVFDKWINVLPKLRKAKRLNEMASSYRRSTLLNQTLFAWRHKTEQKQEQFQMTTVFASCRQDMTLRKCFRALATYSDKKRKQRMQTAALSGNVSIRLLQRSFSTWLNRYQTNMSLRQTAICLTDAREVKLIQKSLQALRLNVYRKTQVRSIVESKAFISKQRMFDALVRYTKTQQSRRAQKSLVGLFRRRQLLRRTMQSLALNQKLGQSKHDLSRKCLIFTAWKALTKENSLLNKYLKECNFQSRPRTSSRGSRGDISSIMNLDEETKYESQLSFADQSKAQKNYATAEVRKRVDARVKEDFETTQKDINFLYGCQPTLGDEISLKKSSEFQVDQLVTRPPRYRY